MSKDLKIVPYRPDLTDVWDNFVANSNNGTVFHRQAFLGYHDEAAAKNFRHLLFYQGDELVALLPAGVTEGSLNSPTGASFGGFVTNDLQHAYQEDLLDGLLGFAREQSLSKIKMTPAPFPYHQIPNAALEFALLRKNFVVSNRDLCQVIDLRALAGQDPLSTYSYACSKQVRKALRAGIEVKTNPELGAFHAILTANRARHNAVPTHSLAQLESLSLRIPEAFHLFGAYQGEELLAGMLCFAANPKVLLNFYSCHREEFSGTGSANLLIHYGIDWARQRGFHYYDFGTSSIRMQPNPGLIRFKESFGGGSFLRDTYLWEAS